MAYRRKNRYSTINNGLKAPFSIFNPHTYDAPVMRNKNIIITSIDPGIVNCGIYVGCYNIETEEHTSIFLGRLTFNTGENHYTESMKQLEELEEKEKCFSSSHYIVIESQMTISYDNTRMAQHLITYFSSVFKNKGNRPLIIEFTSQAKTRLLECPKGLKKYQYKKWCKEKAKSLLESREKDGEKKFIRCLEVNKKTDDMGDSICQYYAWILVMNGKSYEFPHPIKRY